MMLFNFLFGQYPTSFKTPRNWCHVGHIRKKY